MTEAEPSTTGASGQPETMGARTRAEIGEQPRVLRALVDRADEIATAVRRAAPRPLRGLVLVARGSSDNAAIFGRYVLELAVGVPVVLAAPSLQTRYEVTPALEGFLAVGVSQSGRTPEIVSTVERLRAGGAATLALTNEADTPLAASCDAAVVLGTGPEEAVPATKTFTAQVAAFALLADALADVPWRRADWDAVLDAVEEVVADPGPAAALADAVVDADRVLPVGRGLLLSAALEVGLKLAETTGAAVHAYSAADLLHGPIATVGPGTLALCLTAAGPTAQDVRTTADALAERGAALIGMGADRDLLPRAPRWLPVPAGAPEPLATIPYVVRGQQLAERAAVAAGVDPDRPFDLSKVTPTT